MSVDDLLAKLPTLSVEDRARVQAKLDELDGGWCDDGELSEADKAAIAEGLLDLEQNPDDVRDWNEVYHELMAKYRRS